MLDDKTRYHLWVNSRKSINHKFTYSSLCLAIPFTPFDFHLFFVDFNTIDILKHFVIELISFIFEESSYLFASRVHHILFGYLVLFDFVQKLDNVIYSII